MANDKHSDELGYKQRSNGRMDVHHTRYDLRLAINKGVNKMAQVKWALFLCDMLGIPATFLGILANIDNVKSIILFILSMIYIMIRAYYYAVQKQQSVREKEIDLWHKEMDKQERVNKNKSL